MCPPTATTCGKDVSTEMTSTWSRRPPTSQRTPRNGSVTTRFIEPPVSGTAARSASAHRPRNTSDHLQLSGRGGLLRLPPADPGEERVAGERTGEVVALDDVGAHRREHLPGQ